jgi:ATP-binding cassette subfamily B (MDR/TAP) protein 1
MDFCFVRSVIAFCSLSTYSTLLQTAAGEMTIDLKTKWYQALLRQDLTYYDIQDVSGTATMISINSAKYQRGVGNKLGLAVQFVCTFLGGIIYAFYASWRTSLLVLLTVPFMAVSGWSLVKMNTSQTQRANASYAEAGSIVYTTVTSIRTILSLNAANTMIQKFVSGTERAYQDAVSQVAWLGLANGSMMASFLLSSITVPLFGGFLLYDQVRDTGCDPSGAVSGVDTCNPSGVDVFGAMFGIFFAASVLPQISTTAEAFNDARAACFLALEVISRTTADSNDDETSSVDGPTRLPVRRLAGPERGIKNTSLPKYCIDSSSPNGEKPENVEGNIELRNVTFSYPTRLETKIFDEFSLSIEAGKTVAIVGPSGGGKSTIAQLIERFYDPIDGSIALDGTDLRDLNVRWLREQIGLVSQEPSLFACSIRENIAHGSPDATTEQVEEAAKVADAHGFIVSFPEGYNTQVGDKGAKLSGGTHKLA